MSYLDEFGTWMGGATGPFFNPKKRYGKPMALKGLIKDFIDKVEDMEDFLMSEAYDTIIEDKHFVMYPLNEIEELAIRDLIEYYQEREEYEKCAKIVKYLEEGKK